MEFQLPDAARPGHVLHTARGGRCVRGAGASMRSGPGAVPRRRVGRRDAVGDAYRAAVSRSTRRYHVPSALRPSPVRIEVDDARERLADGAFLVDVRRTDDAAHPLPDSARIPPDEIADRLDELPPGVPILLACT